MIRNDQELASRDRKGELGLHCQNMKVGEWVMTPGKLGVVYVVVETSLSNEEEGRPKTRRTSRSQGLGGSLVGDLQEWVV